MSKRKYKMPPSKNEINNSRRVRKLRHITDAQIRPIHLYEDSRQYQLYLEYRSIMRIVEQNSMTRAMLADHVPRVWAAFVHSLSEYQQAQSLVDWATPPSF